MQNLFQAIQRDRLWKLIIERFLGMRMKQGAALKGSVAQTFFYQLKRSVGMIRMKEGREGGFSV